MKTLGRIILFIVGALLIGFAIPQLINEIRTLNEFGWFNFGIEVSKASSIAFITTCINAFAGLVAVLACFRGRSSFFLFLISAVMIGFVIWYFVSANQAGLFTDGWTIFTIVCGFALPIFYVLGSILILFPSKK